MKKIVEGMQNRLGGTWRHVVLTAAVLAVGAILMFIGIWSKKEPQRARPEYIAPLVEVYQLDKKDIQMVVHGYGTVSPKVKVEVVPQIAGKIVSVNPQFKAGGFLKAGEIIFKIDPRDYELAVQQAKAGVAEAKVKLDMEHAEAAVAKKEWEDLNPGTEPASSLVLREPQVLQAQATLESAKARLAVAQLNLDRTIVTLPEDVVVMEERVDLGQFVAVGQSVGSAYGIHVLEIEVPIEDKELAWFNIPDNPVSMNGRKNETNKITEAEVRANFAGGEYEWDGYVARTTGTVDEQSRLVSVVVDVKEPFKNDTDKPPLVPGMFVEVLIKGRIMKDAVAIPRDAIRRGDQVWIVQNDILEIRDVDIVRTDKEFAYVTTGFDDKTVIVTSSLDTVTDGMKVRVEGQQQPEQTTDTVESKE